MIGILGYIFICTTIILGYAVYNLLMKLEDIEEELLDSIDKSLDMKFRVSKAIDEMRSIDSREAFEKDDETGTIFTALLDVVNELEDTDD